MSLNSMQIDGPNRPGRPLRRIDVAQEPDVDEALIRDMLFDNPDLLSPDAAGDADRLTPVAKELNTEAGRIDVLFVDPAGRLTIVETKLLSNPQAHREVVTQIIGYAGALAGWTFDDLNDAVGRASKGRGDLNQIVRAKLSDDAALARFERRLSDRLPRGDFELLIVGDRISDKALRLSEAIAAAPALRFRLSFIELEIYRASATESWPWIVVPRVVEKIVDRERFVVRIEHAGVPPATLPTVVIKAATTRGGADEDEPPEERTGRVGDADTYYKSPDLPAGFGEVFRAATLKWIEAGGDCSPSARLFRWTMVRHDVEWYPLICKTSYIQVNRSATADDDVELSPMAHARYLDALRTVPAAAKELARGGRRVPFKFLSLGELTIILDATLALADDLRRPGE